MHKTLSMSRILYVFHMPLTNPKPKTRYASLSLNASLCKESVLDSLQEMWDNSPQWHCWAMCPGHYSPELVKAVTQLSDNLFSNPPLPYSSEHPRASPWWREATLSEITKLQGKVKTHHWLKSRTSRQSHIYGHSPLNQTFRGVLPQVAWRSTDNSSLCFALTLQGSSFCFLERAQCNTVQ